VCVCVVLWMITLEGGMEWWIWEECGVKREIDVANKKLSKEGGVDGDGEGGPK